MCYNVGVAKEVFSVINGEWLLSKHGREAMAACNRADRFTPLCKESKERRRLRLKQLEESIKPPDSKELAKYPVVNKK